MIKKSLEIDGVIGIIGIGITNGVGHNWRPQAGGYYGISYSYAHPFVTDAWTPGTQGTGLDGGHS